MSDKDSLFLPRPLRLHVGHHFFGAGNLGDDLMLAGFLDAVSSCGRDLHLTCASAFDSAGSQPRRFPQIDWLPYATAARESAICDSDAWIGVGDTPFQIAVGPWFIEHLAADLELCRKHGKRMYFVGIGVEQPAALDDLRARELLAYATHLWARDDRSADLISAAGGAGKVTAAADLAHVHLSARHPAPIEPGTVAYGLNFEDSTHFSPSAFEALSDRFQGQSQRWLVQEYRPLMGSERVIYDALPASRRANLPMRVPDYERGTLGAMLDSWGSPQTLITSRYHAAVIGAWLGARVVAIERSDKIRGLAAQSSIVSVPNLREAAIVLDAVDRARPVDRWQLLALAAKASRACEEMIEQISGGRSSSARSCQ